MCHLSGEEGIVAEPKRVGSIEVDQDLDHVRRLWRVQRIGWGVMSLVVLAGLLGLFGRGPLADGHAQASGLTIDYERFARHGATSVLEAEVEPQAQRGDSVKLWVSRDYLDGVELERVIPEPGSVETRENLVLFSFATADRSRPTRITLHMRPQAHWSREVRAGIDGGSALSFRQFIYP